MENAVNLKPTYKVRNGIKLTRNEKRRGMVELEYFKTVIEPICDNFEMELFNDISIENYKEIYNRYLIEVTNKVEFCNRIKYKVIEVNPHFFEKTYKPVESVD